MEKQYRPQRFQFKEKGWGDVFKKGKEQLKKAGNAISNTINTSNAITDAAKAVNKVTDGAVANTLKKGLDTVSSNVASGIDKVGKATGLDTSGLKSGLNSEANSVKNAIDCYFGKCPSGSTPSGVKPTPSGTQPTPSGSQPAPSGTKPVPSGSQPAPSGTKPNMPNNVIPIKPFPKPNTNPNEVITF